MSDNNGRTPMTQPNRLTHKKLYAACEALKKHKQKFFDERPPAAKAAAMLGELCGFAISEASMSELKELTGVTWQAKMPPRTGGGKSRAYAVRTLTVALRRLYVKLNEEVPEAVERLYRETTGGDVQGDEETQP